MLNFNAKWRFVPPTDGRYSTATIPQGAIQSFDDLIGKTATQGDRWDILEHFKEAFCTASGSCYVRRSSASWADTDLNEAMKSAATNAPLFLEAFYDACVELRSLQIAVPDAEMINAICEKHGIGYVLDPPELVLRVPLSATSVAVVERPPTLAESALELLHGSLQRAEQLQAEGHHREAVQETLWVLESLTTAFRGVASAGSTVSGKYFNDIVKDLRKMSTGTTLNRVLEWLSSLHGYLSSPTGGGVRHGLDLSSGVPIGAGEARLFCNLIRSYVSYLLSEHERLQG